MNQNGSYRFEESDRNVNFELRYVSMFAEFTLRSEKLICKSKNNTHNLVIDTTHFDIIDVNITQYTYTFGVNKIGKKITR